MTEPEEGSFGKLQKEITAALVQTTKSAGVLANEDLNFLRTSNPELTKALDRQRTRFLTTIRRLVRCAVKDTGLIAPSLSKAEDLEDGWSGIVEIVDNLLEKADRCLDEYSGAVRISTVPEPTESSHSKSRYISRAENITKPQSFFANPPQNNLTSPFTPLLRSKPNAFVSLEDSIAPKDDDGMDIDSLVAGGFKHPYAYEITAYKYPTRVYTTSEPIPSHPYESTTAIWVDTIEAVHEMLAELRQAKEIAIDLEHHDIRTYTGLVSLLQISTRDKDWIVDTLKPWREELQVLNEVFTDPDIIKILHGAHMDIIWLQRDLGLYIVGLFDTYFAARSLNYVKHSLAYLLSKFVNFDAQKQYQLADWRARPLSSEMFNYARSDTHFLLYIYDNMKNELLGKANGGPALVTDVLEESKKIALQRYERSNYDAELGIGDRGWYQMLVKTPAVFNKEQFSVFKAIHQWRDQVTRREDEGPGYLISTTTLFNLARDMPSTLPDLQSHFNRKVDILSSRLSELLNLIKEAKARGVDGPDMNDFMAKHPALPDYLAKKAARKQEFVARAAVEKKIRSMAEIASQELLTIPGENLRAEKSLFWGSTLQRHNPGQIIVESQSLAIQFQIPLPDFTAEIFAAEGEAVVEATRPALPPEHAYIKPSNDMEPEAGEEVFTLKEQGGVRKRKHRDIEPQVRSQSTEMIVPLMIEADSILLDPDQTQEDVKNEMRRRRDQDKRRKGERKAAKAAKRNGLRGDDDAGRAFDYANAPSVLNAKHELSESKQGKNRTPVINPYAKSMDAPKGLPKKKKDIQGKSVTFRS